MGRTGKPHIVVALQLNGATGRNEFLGISRFLSHGRSWNLTLAQSADDVNAALARNEIDGAIVGLLHDARTLELVASSRIPTVLIDIGSDRVGGRTDAIAYVRNDDLAIGRMAAEFFASLGQFRAHAFVHPPVPRPWADLRERSFFEAVRARNQSVFRPGENEDLGGFLKRLPKPAAVLAAWDRRAQDVIVAARKAGLKIPEQISVLGVDDDEIYCDNFHPPISSVKPDHVRMGETAARLLERLLRDPACAAGTTKRLPPIEVVARESTASTVSGAAIVARARAYIVGHALHAPTPDEVAGALHVSRRLLDKRFRELTDITVAGLIRETRLKLLKAQLLRHRKRPIAVLTHELGYPNPRAVKNLFLKTFGFTMREWRRRNDT